eukprot:2163125-Prymnesium_polylepis.1
MQVLDAEVLLLHEMRRTKASDVRANEPPKAPGPVAGTHEPDRHQPQAIGCRVMRGPVVHAECAHQRARCRHKGVHASQHLDQPPLERVGRECESEAHVRKAREEVEHHATLAPGVKLEHLVRFTQV